MTDPRPYRIINAAARDAVEEYLRHTLKRIDAWLGQSLTSVQRCHREGERHALAEAYRELTGNEYTENKKATSRET